MARPNLPVGLTTAASAEHVPWFPLIKMEFDAGDGGTLYIAGTDFDVEYDGQDWISARGFGSMEAIVETPDEVAGIKFTLAGVPEAVLAEALLVKYQGRPCTVLWACLDGGTLYVDPSAWKGRLDVPEISRGKGSRSITVTAEHRLVDWQRSRRLLFNDADQRRVDPTDTFFLGSENMAELEITLFSKDVMRKAKGP